MGYTYTPTYYTSSLHDSITSICKNILPFSFKKKRLPAIAAAEQRLSKQQSDNLKWQQESFHQILNLMGLCKEGILAETEVSAFRTHLLETLIAAPLDYEQSIILRDKLIFLQELLYASCISDDEYHASKRPLLQRLAVQGAEIEASDVIVGVKKDPLNEEWSVIDLKEDKFFVNPKMITLKNTTIEHSTKKKIKGFSSVFDLVSPNKYGKLKEKDVMSGANNNKCCAMDLNVSTDGIRGNALVRSVENPFWNSGLNESENELRSILMMESSPVCSIAEKQNGSKKKENAKSAKKIWGFDGFKKWKKNESEDETAPLSLMEKSDGGDYGGTFVANPIVEGSDTKQMKRKLHLTGAPSDFFVDKVLGDNINKELSRVQTELGARNPHIQLSDVQIDTISTRPPADEADLNKFFPKSWCDRQGEVVLDVVKKKFKDHVGEMGNSRAAIARENNKNNSKRWTIFDDHDQENSHPNLFAPQQDNSYSMKQTSFSASKNVRTSFNSSIDKGFKYNPFFDM